MKFILALLTTVSVSMIANAESPVRDVRFYTYLLNDIDSAAESDPHSGVKPAPTNAGSVASLTKIGFIVIDIDFASDSAKNCEIFVTLWRPKKVEELRFFYSSNIATPEWQGEAWDPLESTCRHASLSIL